MLYLLGLKTPGPQTQGSQTPDSKTPEVNFYHNLTDAGHSNGMQKDFIDNIRLF